MNNNCPDIALIGAAKTGSTSLAKVLNLHPDICLGKLKEPEFFSDPEKLKKGIENYKFNFAHAKSHQLTLDASTSYSKYPQYPDVVKYLYKYSPKVKIIYIMRNPVERAYSHYVHRYTKEVCPNEPILKSFNEFIKQDPMCIDSSNYQLQIEQYLKYFNINSMYFVFSHELKQNQSKVLKDICNFLNIKFDNNIFDFNEQVNVTSDYLDSRIKIKITDKLKKLPGVKYVVPFVPKFIRNKLYTYIKKTGYFKGISDEFKPPPLNKKEKLQLINDFTPSIKWVENLLEKDLSIWYK